MAKKVNDCKEVENLVNDVMYYARLWRMLERYRQWCMENHKRFCLRRVVKLYFGETVMLERQILQACRISLLGGYEELPPAASHPRRQREMVRALACMELGLTERRINLHLMDAAYSVVFPDSTPLNINKKKLS